MSSIVNIGDVDFRDEDRLTRRVKGTNRLSEIKFLILRHNDMQK